MNQGPTQNAVSCVGMGFVFKKSLLCPREGHFDTNLKTQNSLSSEAHSDTKYN